MHGCRRGGNHAMFGRIFMVVRHSRWCRILGTRLKGIRMRRLALLAASVVMGVWGVAAPARAETEITFPSYTHKSGNPYAFDKGKYKSDGIKGRALLNFPNNGAKPYPLVVILPSSGGYGDIERDLNEQMIAQGYATLVVDPFSPRGLSFYEGLGAKQTGVSTLSYANDVIAAINVISANADIDASRIAVVGNSMGGGVQLFLASKWFTDRMGLKTDIRALIPISPSCWWRESAPAVTSASTLLMLAGSDDWNLAWQCEDWAKRQQSAGRDIVVEVFPNAEHSFMRTRTRDVDAVAYHCADAIFDLDAMVIHSPDGTNRFSMADGGYIDFWKSINCLKGTSKTMQVGGDQSQRDRAMKMIINFVREKLG